MSKSEPILTTPSQDRDWSLCNLSGDVTHKFDAQRRVAIPASWRTESPDGFFYLVPGKGSTLQIYTTPIYNERIVRKLKALSVTDPDDLRKLRLLGSQIYKCECDKQGRIQIPQKMAEFAHLTDCVALVGSGDFGQILDGERWQKEKAAQDQAFDDSFLDILG